VTTYSVASLGSTELQRELAMESITDPSVIEFLFKLPAATSHSYELFCGGM
jgi:hypothetical protein